MTHIHPNSVLFKGEKPFPIIAACEHYAGNEKFMLKALELQQSTGLVFDVNCDCEDGAAPGREREHAEMIACVLRSDKNVYVLSIALSMGQCCRTSLLAARCAKTFSTSSLGAHTHIPISPEGPA